MNEPPDAGRERGLHDRPGAVLVDPPQAVLVPLPVGDEPGQVDDAVVPGHGRAHGHGIGDIAGDDADARVPPRLGDDVAGQDEGVDGGRPRSARRARA